jgi:RNA polymerase sigma-70 factor (sigma-E family)
VFDVQTTTPGRPSGDPLGGLMTDSTEFEDFVAARYGALLRTAYLLTQDRALAEDLVQATLAKCWPNVHRAMVNTYTAWWRRRWNNEYPTEELPQTGEAGGQPGADDRADLGEALRRLPRKMRATIVLRFYEDLTEAETARILGCSVGNVKSQTSRALAKLRIDPALLDSQEPDPATEQS